MQEDEKSKVLLLESDNSKLMVSPVQVYHMNNNLKGSVCDENGICRINFTFEWLNPEAVCSSNFVCTALGGFHLHLLVFPFVYQFNSRKVHTVAEYSWSIANNFVIGVYCRCLEILCQIVFSSTANYFRFCRKK